MSALSSITIHLIADLPAPAAEVALFHGAAQPVRIAVDVEVSGQLVRARYRCTEAATRRYGRWFVLLTMERDGRWTAPGFGRDSEAGRLERAIRRRWDHVAEAGRKIGVVIP